jgi:hypothetical protein
MRNQQAVIGAVMCGSVSERKSHRILSLHREIELVFRVEREENESARSVRLVDFQEYKAPKKFDCARNWALRVIIH